MYFWNIQKAKEDLKNGTIDDARAIPYFLLMQLTFFLPLFLLDQKNSFELFTNIVSALCLGLGIYFSYQANGGKLGRGYFKKYFVLSWVLTVRLILIVSAGILFLSFLFLAITKENELAIAIFTSVLEVFYTVRLVKHFRELRDFA